MKLTVLKPVEIEVSFIRINVPVRYGIEDIPKDFPFRRPWRGDDSEPGVNYDRWDVTIAIDNGQIQGWPAGNVADLCLKVCDEGVYTLLNHCGEELAVTRGYVPGCIPTGGDYVEFEVEADGTIRRWAKYCTPEEVQTEFFKGVE